MIDTSIQMTINALKKNTQSMFLHFCIEKSNNVGGKLKGGTNKKGFNDYIIDYLSLQQKEDRP